MSFAEIGHDIWVGNAAACDARGHEFPLGIHIWYGPAGDQSAVCRQIRAGQAACVLCYVDNESLLKTGPLENIAAYARQPGRLFVHCFAGITRGPTVAALCKVARGCAPEQALADVARGMWRGYRHAPNFGHVPLNEIFAFADSGHTK